MQTTDRSRRRPTCCRIDTATDVLFQSSLKSSWWRASCLDLARTIKGSTASPSGNQTLLDVPAGPSHCQPGRHRPTGVSAVSICSDQQLVSATGPLVASISSSSALSAGGSIPCHFVFSATDHKATSTSASTSDTPDETTARGCSISPCQSYTYLRSTRVEQRVSSGCDLGRPIDFNHPTHLHAIRLAEQRSLHRICSVTRSFTT